MYIHGRVSVFSFCSSSVSDVKYFFIAKYEILIILDAIREVRKYSGAESVVDIGLHTANADAIIHMRLFRAQRNLYISGFALFLWL